MVEQVTTPPPQVKTQAPEPSESSDEMNLEGYTVSKSELAKMGFDMKGPKKLDISKFANDVEDPADEGPQIEEEEEVEEDEDKVEKIAKSIDEEEEEETEEPYEESEEVDENEQPKVAKKLEDTDEFDITVDGETEKVTIAKAKELLQKRLHFSREMRAVREKEKELEKQSIDFETTKHKWNTENQEKIHLLELYESFFEYLSEADAEVLAKNKEHFKYFHSQFHNPVINRELAKKDAALEAANKRADELENRQIRQEWENQKDRFERTFESKYKPLFERSKIKLDMEALKKDWCNTDKSLLEVFEAKYAKSLAALSNSKSAVESIKKTPKNIPTIGKPRPRGVPAGLPKMKRMDHGEIAERVIAQMGFN